MFVIFLYLVFGILGLNCGANIFLSSFEELHKEPNLQRTRSSCAQTLWIEQKRDHFNDEEKNNWKMVKRQQTFNFNWLKLSFEALHF